VDIFCEECGTNFVTHESGNCLDKLIHKVFNDNEDGILPYTSNLDDAWSILGIAKDIVTQKEINCYRDNKKNTSTVTVFLTKEQVGLAEYIGTSRNGAKSKFLQNQVNYSRNDNNKTHVIGALAEVAFSLLTKNKVDMNFYTLGDLTDFNGIDVKTASHKGKDIELKIPIKEFDNKPQNIYVLSRYFPEDYNKIEFIGAIEREELEKVKKTKQYLIGGPMNYVVEASNLHPIYQFKEVLNMHDALFISKTAVMRQLEKQLV